MVDSRFTCSHCICEGRTLDSRVIDRAWREDRCVLFCLEEVHSHSLCCPHRLPVLELDVPAYELPLPEGVGEERHVEGAGGNLSMREIEETWRERLHDNPPTTQPRHPSQ